MIDLEKSKGMGVFGAAYKVLMENDSHAPDSVDRYLIEEMILLTDETAEYLYNNYTPLKIQYKKGNRLKLESHISNITKNAGGKKITEAIAEFTCSLQDKAEQDLNKIKLGGIEEDIIERGSDFCGELARVGCVLYQIAGVPSRIVALADIDKAYTGHFIVEAFYEGFWGAIDTTTNVVYKYKNGIPATVWDLMQNHQLIEHHWRDKSTPFTNPGQFKAAAITNYFVWDMNSYDYIISNVNEYYRVILDMSNKGWPGGLRWLHGEEKILDTVCMSRVKSQICYTVDILKSRGYHPYNVKPQEFIDYMSGPTPTGDVISLEGVLKSRYYFIHEVVEISELKKIGIAITPSTVMDNHPEVFEAHILAFELELALARDEGDHQWIKSRICLVDSWLKDTSLPDKIVQRCYDLRRKYSIMESE